MGSLAVDLLKLAFSAGVSSRARSSAYLLSAGFLAQDGRGLEWQVSESQHEGCAQRWETHAVAAEVERSGVGRSVEGDGRIKRVGGRDSTEREQSGPMSCILLEDGRFAFLMVKEHFDLCSLIERNMKSKGGEGSGPFSKEEGRVMM